LKALARHTDQKWVLMYVERWLEAPMLMPGGSLVPREKGTPQGSPISPLIANLFLHYGFDAWMVREFPAVQFERFADDRVPRTQKEGRCRTNRRMRCCMRDEGARLCAWWSFAVVLQGKIANHREVRRSRAGVPSVAEKARLERVRCGFTKASESEPPLKCRKRIGDVRNRSLIVAPGRAWREPVYWPGGCPAWMVARA